MSNTASYVAVKLEVMYGLVDAAVHKVADCLKWSHTSAFIMLQHHGWSAHSAIQQYARGEGASTVPTSVVVNMDDRIGDVTGVGTCAACLKSLSTELRAAALPCGHACCYGCWGAHIDSQLNIECGPDTTVGVLRCPVQSCAHRCSKAALDHIFGSNSPQSQRYMKRVVEASLRTHGRLCPSPKGCNYVICYVNNNSPPPAGEPAAVLCDCDYCFCFNCGCENHSPAPCGTEQQTTGDEMDNIKRCPRKDCGVPIEKDEGCNRITCPFCELEWCWVCREPWPCPGGNHASVRECTNTPAFDAATMALTVQAPPSSSRVATPLAATPRQQQQQQKELSIVQNVRRAVVIVGECIAGAVVAVCDLIVGVVCQTFNWIFSCFRSAVANTTSCALSVIWRVAKFFDLTKEDISSHCGLSSKGPQQRAGPLQLEA